MNVRLNSFYDPKPSQFVSAMEAFVGKSVKFSEVSQATQVPQAPRNAEMKESDIEKRDSIAKEDGIEKEANDTNSKIMINYCKKGELLRTCYSPEPSKTDLFSTLQPWNRGIHPLKGETS
jgi:hypothetical protein